MEDKVTISIERYDQLIRAENDANHLKAMIFDKCKTYESIPYKEIVTLYAMYFGNKEDNNV